MILELFLGFVLGSVVLGFLIWKLFLKGSLVEKLPSRLEPPKIHTTVYEIIMDQDDKFLKEGRPAESATWFNKLFQSGFAMAQPSKVDLWDRFVWDEFRELPFDIRRFKAGYFIRGGHLVDYHFGSSFPVFKNLHTMKIDDFLPEVYRESYKDLFVIASDLEYDGDLELHMQLDTVFDRQIDLYACLERIRGRYFVVLHKDYFYHGLRPTNLSRGTKFEISFRARFIVDGWWEWGLVNRILERIVFPIAYKFKFVIPFLKGKWFQNAPEQPPYPWDLTEETSHLLHSWTSKYQEPFIQYLPIFPFT
jgi:hypothetical protein